MSATSASGNRTVRVFTHRSVIRVCQARKTGTVAPRARASGTPSLTAGAPALQSPDAQVASELAQLLNQGQRDIVKSGRLE